MNRRTIAVCVMLATLLVSGCVSGQSPTATDSDGPDTGGAPDVRLSSIGQDTINNGTGIQIQGSVTNYGDTAVNATMTVQLLSGESVVRERQLPVGVLSPDESTAFSTAFDVNASEVDGRRITFD